MKIWYAIQKTREDAWDYGSFDHSEAVKLAKALASENGEAIIAHIEDDHKVCVSEEIIRA